MRELRPGLWHWTAPHPDWESSEPWDQNVSSYATVPSQLEELAGSRETAIVLTAPWHERDKVVSGDTLVDFGQGLEINEGWLRPGVTRADVVQGLHPLLDLPVELVLSTHGGPTDRAALERALSV